jgi:raffinose/stachyose/melibiose transport system substrate-binding protein
VLRHARGAVPKRKAVLTYPAVVLASSSVLVGLAGPASATPVRATGSAPVTLSIEFQKPTLGSYGVWLVKQLSAFAKAHNVKWQIADTLSSNAYLAKLTTQMAAGTEANILSGWTYGRLTPYAASGRLVDLTPYLNADPSFKKSILPEVFPSEEVKGQIYGVPMTLDAEVLFYNKALFNKYGASVPKTYSQLLSDVTLFKNHGVIPMVLGNQESWNGSIPYEMLADALGGLQLYNNVVIKHTTPFANATFLKAGEMFQQLEKAGAFNSGFQSDTIQYAQTEFVKGKAAMFINGTWEVGTIDALGNKLGWFNFPVVSGGVRQPIMVTLPNNSLSVSSHVTGVKRTLAVEFLKSIFTRNAQLGLLADGQPIAGSITLPANASPILRSIHQAEISGGQSVPPWDLPLGTQLGEQLDNATAAMLQGTSPKSALAQVDSDLKVEGTGA